MESLSNLWKRNQIFYNDYFEDFEDLVRTLKSFEIRLEN